MLRQALSARMRPIGRTLGHLWRLARHPRNSFNDARASADAFVALCEGGLVVSTAFPTADQIARLKALPAPGQAADAAAKAPATLADTSDPGAGAGVAEPVALRTVLQADGSVSLLIDRGFAAGDQHVLTGLVQVHAAAVREALAPLVRAQGIALALRASVRVAVPACGLLGGAAAHWVSDLLAALVSAAVSAALTAGLLVSLRWALEAAMRRKVRKLLQG